MQWAARERCASVGGHVSGSDGAASSERERSTIVHYPILYTDVILSFHDVRRTENKRARRPRTAGPL